MVPSQDTQQSVPTFPESLREPSRQRPNFMQPWSQTSTSVLHENECMGG